MKKILCLILSVVLVLSLVPSVSALDTTDYAGAKAVSVGETVQTSHTGIGDDWFKFTADEDQYYKITILNQSVELRTNIYFDSWLDSSLFGAFFNGKLYVAIRDSHGLEKAEGTVRCGYEGSVSLLLSAGETYYIGFNSNYSGNFRFTVEKLNDMGGNSEAEATEITATAQIISMVDAKDDEDWFTFETDSDPSFYHFSLENLNSRYSVYLTLYEFVEGAGLRFVKEISAGKTAVRGFNSELKVNTKYYYRVTSSSEGGYVIDVEQYFDAVSSEKKNAYPIERDVKITSSYDGDDDTDLYKFTTADFDAYYHINYKPLTDVYYYVKLIDSAGTELISTSRNGSTSFSGNIKLEKNTEYYLSFKGDKKGNYEFSLDTFEDPVPDEREEAHSLERDKKITASYAGDDDTDFYKFTTADFDAYYHINYKPLTDVYYYVKLIDSAGTELISTSRNGMTSYSGNIKLEKNTEYYLSFKGDKKGNYEFSLDTAEDPVPDVREEAHSLERDKKITASYAGDDDTDFYKFTTADFDAYYHINYKPLTDVYYYVKLIDSAGTELISASRNGMTSYSGNIKLEKNTEYYLSFKGDKKGNYEFSFDTAEDPEGSSKETAVAIETDREYKKQYAGNGDTDCYYFTAPDEDSFICFNYTPTDDVYYYAEIHDLAGEKLIDISRGGSSVYNGSFRAERGEIYYISLKGDKKGEYKFSVNTVKDPAGEKREASQEISLNSEIKADLASNSDTDWYKFTVSDFESFRVRILTESGNSKRVSLYSDRDMELLYLSGTADRVKELEAGTYYLKVTGSAGYYTLVVGNCGEEHSWVLKRVVKPATCKEKGTESYYCECCYSQKTETVPMLDTHSFEWVIEKEARPGEAGKKVQKCTVCSARGDTMTYTAVLLGDADKNGSITAADARFVLRAAVNLEKCEDGTELFTVCDVDKNKVITASDARLILRTSVNLETLN